MVKDRKLVMKYFVIKLKQQFNLGSLQKQIEEFGYPKKRLFISGEELAQILLNTMEIENEKEP